MSDQYIQAATPDNFDPIFAQNVPGANPVMQNNPDAANYMYVDGNERDNPQPERYRSITENLTYGAASVVAGAVDTFGQSLRLLNQDSVTNYLKGTEFGDFYTKNRDWARTVADLGTFMIPGMAAESLAMKTGWLAKTAQAGGLSDRVASTIFASGEEASGLLAGLETRALLDARKTTQIDWSTKTGPEFWRSATSDITKQSVTDAFKKNVAFEIGVAATMNKSDVLYPDDWSLTDHLMLAAPLPVVGAGIEYYFMRRQIANIATKAGREGMTAAFGDISGLTSVSRPGYRDLGLTSIQSQLAKLDEARTNGLANVLNTDEAARLDTNLQSQKATLLKYQDEELDAMAKDKYIPGVTTSWQIGDREKNALKGQFKSNACSSLGITSLEPIASEGRAAGDFYSARMGTLSSNTRSINQLKKNLLNTTALSSEDIAEKSADLMKFRDKNEEIKKTSAVVIGPDGITDASQRGVIAQDWINPTNIRIMPGDKVTDSKRILITGGDSRTAKGIEINLSNAEPIIPESEIVGKAKAGTPYFAGVEIGPYAKRYPLPETADQAVAIQARLNAGDITALASSQIPQQQLADVLGTQTLEQRTATYAGFEKAAEHIQNQLKTDPENFRPISLDPNRHYIIADFAEELYNRLGEDVFKQAVALPSNMGIDEIRMAGLQGKYRDFRIWQHLVNNDPKLAKTTGMNPTNFRYYTNLAQSEMGMDDPVLKTFRGMMMQDEKDLKAGLDNLANVKMAANTTTTIPEQIGPQTLLKDTPTSGKLLNWDIKNNKSTVAIYRETPTANNQSYEALMQANSQQRAQSMGMMAAAGGKFGDEIAPLIFNSLNGTVVASGVADIKGLGQGSIRGSSQLVSRSMAGGDALPITSADNADRILTRIKNAFVAKKFVDTGFSAAMGKVASNDLLKQNWADYQNAKRYAWDTLAEHETVNDGVHLILDPTSKRNQDLYQRLYGEALDTSQDAKTFMPAAADIGADKRMRYQPMLIKNDVYPLVIANQQMAAAVEASYNHLAAQVGKSPIQHKNDWLPSIALNRKFVSFMRDDNGVMHTVATGDTPAELRKSVEAAQEAYGESGKILHEEAAASSLNVADSYDEAFEKLINMVDPLTQTGGSKGALGSYTVLSGDRALQDLHEGYRYIFDNLFRRNRVLYFEPYVKQVRAMDAAIEVTARTSGNDLTTTKKWLNLVYGNSSFDKTQTIGKMYDGAESFFDQKLQALQQRLAPTSASERAAKGEKYAKYADFMGDWNPYSSATDFANRVVEAKTPWNVKDAAASLNKLTSTMTLRLFELGQPIMNMVSLAATMPSVVKGLARMTGETAEQYASRVSPYSSLISPQESLWSGSRTLMEGTHSFFNRMITVDGKEVKLSKYLGDQGYFNQTVNDMQEVISKPQMNNFRRSVEELTNIFSKPADSSESLSRAIAMHSGWEFAEKNLGITNPKDLTVFANKFADDVIGDYRPQNRPQIFQGAIGMPLGLFTTFMWNYNERLFRYIESKNAKAFYTQMGTQAALFGLNSVPGYSQFTNYFASNYDGSSSPITGMRNQFGDRVTDWLSYGTISNLTQMGFSSRGDAGLKMIPTIYNPMNSPAFQGVSKLFEGAGKMVEALKNNGVDSQQIAQILAQFSISRPIRGAMELYNGYSADAQGRIIDSDLRDTLGVVSRVLGVKQLSEVKNTEANYQITSGKSARADKLQELQDSVQAMMRSGTINGSALADRLRDYVSNGGDPGGIAEFMRNSMLTAHMDKNSSQMSKLLTGYVSDKDMDSVRRLIWSRVPPNQKDFFPQN